MLRVLAAHPGEVVSKDDLITAVWGDVHVTEDSLFQCIADIRRALGDDRHRLVQTVTKRGYRLARGAICTEPGVESPAARRRSAWLATALVLSAVLGLAVWWLHPGQPAERPSIAVLPFADLSGSPRWQRLGKGISAEIGADLARGGGFVVIPAETAESIEAGPLAAAEALGARFVVDGTLMADGERLRLTARLTDAATGAVIWSDRWTRPAEGLFDVQDAIVERVGGTLDRTWTGVMSRALRAEAKAHAGSRLAAFELYLLGVEAKHRFTPEALEESVGYLRRALDRDPGFVEAMIALSIGLGYQSDWATDAATAKALIDESFRLAEQSAALDPDNPNALLRLCFVRLMQGRRAEALTIAVRAVDIAPNNPDVLAVAAWCHPFATEERSPLDWAERAIALNRAHPGWYYVPLAQAALYAGDIDLARRAAEIAPQLPDLLLHRAAAEAIAGNTGTGRELFDRFTAETHYRSVSAYYFQDDVSGDPAFAPLVEGARLVGFPVSLAEAEAAELKPLSASGVGSPDRRP